MSKQLFFGACLLLLAGCGPSVEELQKVVQPSLADIQFRVFDQSCALAGCHNVASQKGDLVLEDGQSFAEMVNVLAANSGASADDKLLVVPGDPANSYLFQKLIGPDSGEGLEMPPGESRVISDAAIEAIRLWIEQGALDN